MLLEKVVALNVLTPLNVVLLVAVEMLLLNLASLRVPFLIAPASMNPVELMVKTVVPLLMPGGILEISVYQSTQVSHSTLSAMFER